MKRQRKLQAVLGLNILILLLSMLDYLSLHDIRSDYVSTEILDHLQVTTALNLPSWTATSGEWLAVVISFWARTILLLFSLFLLWQMTKANDKSEDGKE